MKKVEIIGAVLRFATTWRSKVARCFESFYHYAPMCSHRLRYQLAEPGTPDEFPVYLRNRCVRLYENEEQYTRDLYDPLGSTEDVKSFARCRRARERSRTTRSRNSCDPVP